jgi:hypothetical protein
VLLLLSSIQNSVVAQIWQEKRVALSEVVDLYLNGKWKTGEGGSNDSDTGDDEEEFPDMVMRTETAICMIFSGFWHFTGQIIINFNLFLHSTLCPLYKKKEGNH